MKDYIIDKFLSVANYPEFLHPALLTFNFWFFDKVGWEQVDIGEFTKRNKYTGELRK